MSTEHSTETKLETQDQLVAMIEGFSSLIVFNDTEIRKHTDVLQVFDKAIETLNKENSNGNC